jgi:hypothetical protein
LPRRNLAGPTILFGKLDRKSGSARFRFGLLVSAGCEKHQHQRGGNHPNPHEKSVSPKAKALYARSRQAPCLRIVLETQTIDAFISFKI